MKASAPLRNTKRDRSAAGNYLSFPATRNKSINRPSPYGQIAPGGGSRLRRERIEAFAAPGKLIMSKDTSSCHVKHYTSVQAKAAWTHLFRIAIDPHPYSIFSRLTSFLYLKVGWDGYRAEPVPNNLVAMAMLATVMLRESRFQISQADPTVDSTVVIKAQRKNIEVECEFESVDAINLRVSKGGASSYFECSSVEEAVETVVSQANAGNL